MVPDNLVATGPWDTLDYTYDSAGNVISDNRLGDIYTYTYNAANRLSSVSLNGVLQAEYKYNVLGQQVWRKLHPSGQIIHSLFDLDGNRIAEYDYAGGTSTLIREYIWMDGRPVAVVEGGMTYYVRVDHIGRPVFATDGTGAKVWEASYLPFGEVLASTSTPMELRFPGQWFQAESGLHQNWMRDYDPTTGRYMQADPLGLVDGASIYGYARQNPGRYTDPTGELIPALLVGAAVGVGTGYLIDNLMGDGCYTIEEAIVDGTLGLVGGGFGSRLGRAGLLKWLRGLSNNQKGNIGEVASIIRNRLAGSRLIGTQVRPSGFRTIADSLWRGRNGTKYFVESKFGTGSLNRVQRLARDGLGSSYRVERWGYPFWGQIGAGTGVVGGGVAGGSVGGLVYGN